MTNTQLEEKHKEVSDKVDSFFVLALCLTSSMTIEARTELWNPQEIIAYASVSCIKVHGLRACSWQVRRGGVPFMERPFS